jgi:hypothetical protein
MSFPKVRSHKLAADLDHRRLGHPVAGRRPAVAVVVVARWKTSNGEPFVALQRPQLGATNKCLAQSNKSRRSPPRPARSTIL